MKASKALAVSVSVFRGRISWRFSLSKKNISPAAPDLELILFPLWYWPIMNAHTKQQQDKVFEMDFIDFKHFVLLLLCVCIHNWSVSQSDPPICAPFGTKSTTVVVILLPDDELYLPPSNDNQQGCYNLQHCHTPAERVLTSNSHCWHYPQTEKNKFWYCLEPFAPSCD